MENKIAIQRSSEVTEEEREAAKKAIEGFQNFLKQFWAARQQDKRLLNTLEKSPDTNPEKLFEIRHLLRRFQQEVKDRYTQLIFTFAGRKNGDEIIPGALHLLRILEKDTKTRQIKTTLQDAMQQFTQFMEEFLESFEDFNSKDQIKEILLTSQKADGIYQSIENIINKQLIPHFERNVLKRQRLSSLRGNIIRRARIIRMLGEL
jgi:leucyl-tRNA synthetase